MDVAKKSQKKHSSALLGDCLWLFNLLLRKARAVIPDTPSSLLHRSDPSTASHSCNQINGGQVDRLYEYLF